MRRSLGWPAAATLVLLLALTGVSSWLVRGAVHNQEDRLLHERANEVGLVLKEAVDSLSSQLQTVGGVLRATDGDRKAFNEASASLVAKSEGRDTITLFRQTSTGYRADLVSGTAFHAGDQATEQLLSTFTRAGTSTGMVPTSVMGAGTDRELGFALGPPAAPDGTMLYLQVSLGTLGPPRAAGTAPFHELYVVLYSSPTPDPAQTLVTTNSEVPLRGNVQLVPVTAGASKWALQVSAVHPLVGSTIANAAWLILGGGIVIAALITVIVEGETRRRRNALDLYRNERQLAEGLQRSLLPELPTPKSLAVAARYLPGSADQLVGGDWYDVFELDGDRIGLAVGDVLGHDIDAAALMSRVQAALRAYAFIDGSPAKVLDQLDGLLASFNTDRLVTVFFGILGPTDDEGSRQLTFANAGHPPPMVHDRDGGVRDLDDVNSILLGVTHNQNPRRQTSIHLSAGATLVLYTDGLVEVPGESLTDHVELLKRTVAAEAPRTTPAQLCDRLLDTTSKRPRRDDVAVLTARLVSAEVTLAPPRRSRLASLRRQ